MNAVIFEQQQFQSLISTVESLTQMIQEPKRWLSVAEAANYIPYKEDTIYKKLDKVFISGKHFHRKGKTVIMDRLALDAWVLEETEAKLNAKSIVNELLAS